MALSEHTYYSTTTIGTVWGYTNPRLAYKTIDDLFDTWGDNAVYSSNMVSDYEFQITARRRRPNEHIPNLDHVRANMKIDLAIFIDNSFEQYRNSRPDSDGHAWVCQQHDQTRRDNLEQEVA